MLNSTSVCTIYPGLRKKNFSPTGGNTGPDLPTAGGSTAGAIELFGTTDVIVKHVLEVRVDCGSVHL